MEDEQVKNNGIIEAQNEKVVQLQALVQKLQEENDTLNSLLAERWEQILNLKAALIRRDNTP